MLRRAAYRLARNWQAVAMRRFTPTFAASSGAKPPNFYSGASGRMNPLETGKIGLDRLLDFRIDGTPTTCPAQKFCRKDQYD
ncbi:hypothetical protein [Ruegeria sp.]|uniref:hypothetical protein n=1 Tax=Ruegeria sp. TaxID=1879320 RepID=UPI003AFFC5EC